MFDMKLGTVGNDWQWYCPGRYLLQLESLNAIFSTDSFMVVENTNNLNRTT